MSAYMPKHKFNGVEVRFQVSVTKERNGDEAVICKMRDSFFESFKDKST